ncbi:MAG: M3 family oligoendopeptidase [Myxococcota bacterium]|nr:M3 family oligoendopeptidase [Myxococcota bacterium]
MSTHFSEFPYRRLSAEEVEHSVNRVLKDFQNAEDVEEQVEVLRKWDQHQKEWDDYGSISYVHFSQNTADKHAKKEKDFYDSLSPVIKGEKQKIIKNILRSPYRKNLETRFGKNLFDRWELSLQAFDTKIIDNKRSESKLISRYTALLSQTKIPFRGKERTLSTMSPFYSSSDRSTRKEARIAQDKAFERHADTLDDIYDQMVKLRHRMALDMGYASYTEMAYAELSRTDYDKEDVAEFRRQIANDLLPITQNILDKRAQRLGVDSYQFYDEGLMDPQGEIEPKGTHDWMLEQAQIMFSEMGDDFGSFFSMMRERGLMDLKSRENKSRGGYCALFSSQGAPFIFANFNGTQGDVRVFTHECGHAFQCYQSKDVPLSDLIWPTMEAAEIHSMSLEFLTYPWMHLFFKEDTDRFIQSHLERALIFIPYGVAIDEFQHLVYENPDATPADRAKMWKDVEQRYLPHRKYEDLPYFGSGRFWQRQGHLYIRPFYYIDYFLAQTCALQFWSIAEQDRDDAMKRYRSLCKLGGTQPFTQLLKAVKLRSPFEPGAIQFAIQAPLQYLSDQ